MSRRARYPWSFSIKWNYSFFFFKQKTAYEILAWLEFRRVLFRSWHSFPFLLATCPTLCHNTCMTTMVSNARDIQRHALPNGLVVITETMQHVRSVSVGIWVRHGSRRETPAENGTAHFLEHMVFKGTERRSAEDIAREMDSFGGILDAFTSKEQICFNANVLYAHLPIAFDVLSDLVLRPKFDSEDVKKERQVVLEEIKMDMDNPEYLRGRPGVPS